MSMMGFLGGSAANASLDARLGFLRKTYVHVFGAFVAFIAVSYGLYASGVSQAMMKWLSGSGMIGIISLMGGFMLLGWMGTAMSRAEYSKGVQYGGLTLYILAEAIIMAPLIFLAGKTAPDALPSASIVTLLTFGGLTAYVFLTNKDFSFMGPALAILGIVAFGAIVCGALFGFELGVWFSALMILFAGAAILYTTSKVLHTYRTDQYVAASVEIFAAVALLFYYVLRLFLQLRSGD